MQGVELMAKKVGRPGRPVKYHSFNLQLPPSVAEQVRAVAKSERRAVNTELIGFIEYALAHFKPHNPMVSLLEPPEQEPPPLC